MNDQTFLSRIANTISLIVDFIKFSVRYIADNKFLLPLDDEDDQE